MPARPIQRHLRVFPTQAIAQANCDTDSIPLLLDPTKDRKIRNVISLDRGGVIFEYWELDARGRQQTERFTWTTIEVAEDCPQPVKDMVLAYYKLEASSPQ